MGESFRATCFACGQSFEAADGGGFTFIDAHCVHCGRVAYIELAALTEAWAGYQHAAEAVLESIGRSYPMPAGSLGARPLTAIERTRCALQLTVPSRLLHAGLERHLGRCQCGSRFSVHAPVRCPHCRSTNFDRGELLTLYD